MISVSILFYFHFVVPRQVTFRMYLLPKFVNTCLSVVVCNTNKVQDNGETGVDCGGGGCPNCQPGKFYIYNN